MKHPALISFFSAAMLITALPVKAQTDTWVEVSHPDEYFRVLMPQSPKETNEVNGSTAMHAVGKRYETTVDNASYFVWALVENRHRATDGDAYLDACADLIWEGLLKPARDKLPKDNRVRAAMHYEKELTANPFPGREYTLTIGELTGTTQFFVADSRIYILLAMNSQSGAWSRQKFFESFAILPGLPLPRPVDGDPKNSGTPRTNAATTDSDHVFSGRDVTQKVRLTSRVEPTYTEDARKFGVQGTVILRAVFSKDGDVTNIRVINRLPHGLTQQAINAARAIKFVPAQKDGVPVSMYMQLEYNFNLY
jgi:TonB family protein